MIAVGMYSKPNSLSTLISGAFDSAKLFCDSPKGPGAKLGCGGRLLGTTFLCCWISRLLIGDCLPARQCLGSPHTFNFRALLLSLPTKRSPFVTFIRTTNMSATRSRVALIAGLVAHVAGHAYIDKVMVAGTPYSGWLPFKCVLSDCSSFITENGI